MRVIKIDWSAIFILCALKKLKVNNLDKNNYCSLTHCSVFLNWMKIISYRLNKIVTNFFNIWLFGNLWKASFLRFSFFLSIPRILKKYFVIIFRIKKKFYTNSNTTLILSLEILFYLIIYTIFILLFILFYNWISNIIISSSYLLQTFLSITR